MNYKRSCCYKSIANTHLSVLFISNSEATGTWYSCRCSKKVFITISGNETEANWHCQWQAGYLSWICFDYQTEILYCQNRQKTASPFSSSFCQKSDASPLQKYDWVISASPFLLYLQTLSWTPIYTPRLKRTQVKLNVIRVIALCLNSSDCIILQQQTLVLIIEGQLTYE